MITSLLQLLFYSFNCCTFYFYSVDVHERSRPEPSKLRKSNLPISEVYDGFTRSRDVHINSCPCLFLHWENYYTYAFNSYKKSGLNKISEYSFFQGDFDSSAGRARQQFLPWGRDKGIMDMAN